MDMKERNRPLTRMAQVVLIEREAADAGKGGKHVAARIGQRIGIHAAIRESAAVDAIAVYLVPLDMIPTVELKEKWKFSL